MPFQENMLLFLKQFLFFFGFNHYKEVSIKMMTISLKFLMSTPKRSRRTIFNKMDTFLKTRHT